MGRQHVATRLDEPEYEQIEAIMEEKGISKSEAMRRVVQDGLESRGRINTSVNTDESDDSDDNTRVVVNQSVTPAGAAVMLALASGVSSFGVSASAFFSPAVVAFLGCLLGGFGALGAITVTKHQLR